MVFSVNMLYILPPPRAPDPPSPWDSILCTSSSANTNDKSNWGDVKRSSRRPPPPRARFRNLKIVKDDDSGSGLPTDDDEANRTSPKSLSECYFAGKGAALVLPAAEAQKPNHRSQSHIQKHLQSMFYLLRPEETLKMAVKLESVHIGRTRYLVVVSRPGKRSEESCLLGIDCNEKTTVGLVLRVLADTAITLDGDGGFSVSVCGRHHIFKPVSVQAMWSALQTLHKVSSKAREQNYFQGGLSHDWVDYYEQRIESDRSCLNEWHAMDSLESRRPPSPGSVRTKPRERDETEKVIRDTLKEIMMSLDLDEVTSKYIRSRLEEDLDVDLGEFKPFIDQEIMTIFGQMDAPTEIFDHVYLGSEWNASNFEELQKNGVGHILNVTREIDNFFPGTFDYLNVRVYDDEKTDLLKYWDNTFKYITKARKTGSKVLVHCKMGVSRSASVVIAYAMKAYDWDLQKALKHVKDKRSCIKPNNSFISQLETYQGILDAMKNKEKLQRSKSETNLKSPGLVAKNERVLAGSEPTPAIQMAYRNLNSPLSGQDLRNMGARPKSWSPENSTATKLLETKFLSLENLNQKPFCAKDSQKDSSDVAENKKANNGNKETSTRNVLMPFHNGQSYSVSPNQIMHIPGKCIDSVKRRVNSLESKQNGEEKRVADKKRLVLNLTITQQQDNCSNHASPEPEDVSSCLAEEPVVSRTKSSSPNPLTAVIVNKEIWDPGENKENGVGKCSQSQENGSNSEVPEVCKTVVNSNGNSKVTLRRDGDPFSNQVDRVFDREERKQQRLSVSVPPPLPACVTELSNEESVRECPSRQSSWSSYDSAVVLGYQGEPREAPSRHSSWGSGDTRTLPSRNSSWGSYDMRPGAQPAVASTQNSDKHPVDFGSSSSGMFPYDKDDIPWYPGTVRRTKAKLEEGTTVPKATAHADRDSPENDAAASSNTTSTTNSTASSKESTPPSAITVVTNKQIDIVSDKKTNLSKHSGPRLSASAPECSPMDFLRLQYDAPMHSQSVSNVNLIGKCNIRPSKSAGDNSSSAQSPNVIRTQLSSVRHVKNFLENLHNGDTNGSSAAAAAAPCTKRDGAESSGSDSEQQSGGALGSGIVKNLKKEFEAKTTLMKDAKPNATTATSLPSSPVSASKEEPTLCAVADPAEDISVRMLVDKYEEVSTTDKGEVPEPPLVPLRPKVIQVPNRPPLLNNSHHHQPPTTKQHVRHSCFEILDQQQQNQRNTAAQKGGDPFKRPPVPEVVVATVIAKATAKKQQQYGKSHPLARLSIKPRHNNPVYNTM